MRVRQISIARVREISIARVREMVVARARRVQKLLDARELDKARALVEKYNGENWGQGPKKDPK